MIIFGKRARILSSELSHSVQCPNCKKGDSIIMSIFIKYIHIFWIPVFPYGKNGISQCKYCMHTLAEKDMPPELKSAYNNLKSKKSSIAYFAGLILISIIITFNTAMDQKNKIDRDKIIENPQVGDVYTVKLATDRYSLLKIEKIIDDVIYVIPNQYEVNKVSGISQLNKPDSYYDELMEFTRDNIKDMYNDKDIIDVRRD